MTKYDKLDVHVPCFGCVRGCKVAHCDIASACYQKQHEDERELVENEDVEHDDHCTRDSAEIDHDDPINQR